MLRDDRVMCARDQVMNVGKVGYGTFDRDDGIVGRVFVIIRVGGDRIDGAADPV